MANRAGHHAHKACSFYTLLSCHLNMVQMKQNTALNGLRLLSFLLLVTIARCMPQDSSTLAPNHNISNKATASSSTYWIANIQRQGTVAFGNDTSYKIFRNVMDYGARGRPV